MANKFTNIDPNNCTIEELEAEVQRLFDLGEYYETKQLALKKFINSVYGATASKYFLAHNTAVAESITMQGQDLNHFSENSVNEYFSGIFQNDTELHKKLGIDSELAKKVTIGKGKVTETGLLEGSEFWYLNGNQSLVCAGDTDCGPGSCEIYVDTNKQTLESLFDTAKYENNDVVLKLQNGQEIIPVHNHETLTYIDHDSKPINRPIKYIMRHKIQKDMYTFKSASGKELTVTGDHSLMVIRNNELMSIPAREIDLKTDKMITIK